MTRKGYKAYDKGLVCRDKQYEVGQIYEEDKAVICESGMHYCDNPADLMCYHELVDANGGVMEVTEVEDIAADTSDSKIDGQAKKYCTTKLKIGAKVAFKDWVKASVEFLLKRCNDEADSKGEKTASDVDYARLASSGDYAQLASSGDSAQLASSGYYAQLASSGDYARLASSGDYAQLASSGYYAQLASSGDSARLASSGEDSIIAAIGIGGKAKGAVGNWLTLAEWEYDNGKSRVVPKCVKTEYVDGERIKADTFYMLKGGEFKEVEE